MSSCAKTFNAVSSRLNETDYPLFVSICKMSALDLKIYLNEVLRSYYPNTTENADGFLYAKGTLPVLLTAHIDTVHKDLVEDFYEHKTDQGMTIISSPQGIGGDDRCGVYMILRILASTELRPSILFCEDEEIGGIGSNMFCQSEFIEELEQMKFLIELDRANANDAVFYDDDNQAFHKWIEKETGYKEAWGSFSDISNLSPACRISSVNLSCGYYNAHTTNEFVVVEEMLDTIGVVKNLLYKVNEEEILAFKYVESYYSYSSLYNWNRGSNRYYTPLPSRTRTGILEVVFYDSVSDNYQTWAKEVDNEDSGWVDFFFSHTDVCLDMITDYDYYEL